MILSIAKVSLCLMIWQEQELVAPHQWKHGIAYSTWGTLFVLPPLCRPLKKPTTTTTVWVVCGFFEALKSFLPQPELFWFLLSVSGSSLSPSALFPCVAFSLPKINVVML